MLTFSTITRPTPSINDWYFLRTVRLFLSEGELPSQTNRRAQLSSHQQG
jgi:hypothetical protein